MPQWVLLSLFVLVALVPHAVMLRWRRPPKGERILMEIKPVRILIVGMRVVGALALAAGLFIVVIWNVGADFQGEPFIEVLAFACLFPAMGSSIYRLSHHMTVYITTVGIYSGSSLVPWAEVTGTRFRLGTLEFVRASRRPLRVGGLGYGLHRDVAGKLEEIRRDYAAVLTDLTP